LRRRLVENQQPEERFNTSLLAASALLKLEEALNSTIKVMIFITRAGSQYE